jgi:nucleoid-associated protein YgaU
MRIFEANRQLLKAPDEIYAGQKLTIPPLGASASDADKSDGVLSGSMFEKVISIGKKHLLPDRGSAPAVGSGQAPTPADAGGTSFLRKQESPPKAGKSQPAPSRQNAGAGKLARPTNGGQAAEYVVREGDYLWRIAAQQLGDGNRYPEIAKLNADTLPDEDNLTPGMRLKMPAR